MYDALEYEFVDAVTATNRAVFKATKEADDVSAQAAKALWKTTLNIDAAAEKAAFFEPNRAVMRATRVLAMVPGNADALRAVKYEAGSDAVKKLQLHEQKLMQLENDLIQTQEKFASICTLTENGMTTVSNLEGQEEPVGSVLADVFAHRSRVAFSRVLLLSRFSAMRSGLGDDQPPPPSVGGKAISMQEEIEWVIPKTGRFTAHDDSRAGSPEVFVSEPAAAEAKAPAPKTSPRVARRAAPPRTAAPTITMPAPPPIAASFGGNLVGLKQQTGHDLPLIVQTALPWLEADDRLSAEGLFRVSGGAAEVEFLKATSVPTPRRPHLATFSGYSWGC